MPGDKRGRTTGRSRSRDGGERPVRAQRGGGQPGRRERFDGSSSFPGRGARHDRQRPESGSDAPSAEVVLLPGRKPLIELARHRVKSVRRVFLLEGASADAELKETLDRCREQRVAVERRTREELAELSRGEGEETVHQGVLTEITPAASVDLPQLILRAKRAAPSAPFVVLDQVTDPRNLGSIFRAAESAGAAGLIMPADRSSPVSAVVRKTSAGASELLPYSVVTNLDRAIRELKDSGYWIIGAAVGEGSRPLFSTEIPLPAALVLGAEGRGLRRLTQDRCDLLLSLPMAGMIESLNVGQAAAVFLYELMRRRGA